VCVWLVLGLANGASSEQRCLVTSTRGASSRIQQLAPPGWGSEGQDVYVGLFLSAGLLRMAAEDPWAAMERQILSTFHVFCAPSTVHGWGVFAGKDFKRHEVVHEATGHLVRGQPEAIEDDVFDSGSIVGEAEASGFSILGQGPGLGAPSCRQLSSHLPPPSSPPLPSFFSGKREVLQLLTCSFCPRVRDPAQSPRRPERRVLLGAA